MHELLIDLENRLIAHDWHYVYSDDPKYYRIGRNEERVIKQLMETAKSKGLYSQSLELYKKYYPAKDFL